jgi:hypothetical protein
MHHLVRCITHRPETLQVLLQKGLDPDILLERNARAIHVVAQEGHLVRKAIMVLLISLTSILEIKAPHKHHRKV